MVEGKYEGEEAAKLGISIAAGVRAGRVNLEAKRLAWECWIPGVGPVSWADTDRAAVDAAVKK